MTFVRLGLAGLITLAVADKAFAQAVSYADLVGTRIEGLAVQQRVTRNAEGKTGPNRIVIKYVLSPQSEKLRLSVTITNTRQMTGQTDTRSWSAETKLDTPFAFRDGMSVAIFDNGGLTLLRTQEQGGLKTSFEFTRTSSGFACRFNHGFARENGVGGLSSTSALGTARAVILSAKEVSNSCKISKS